MMPSGPWLKINAPQQDRAQAVQGLITQLDRQRERADHEKQRADLEKQRADQEEQQAVQFAVKLLRLRRWWAAHILAAFHHRVIHHVSSHHHAHRRPTSLSELHPYSYTTKKVVKTPPPRRLVINPTDVPTDELKGALKNDVLNTRWNEAIMLLEELSALHFIRKYCGLTSQPSQGVARHREPRSIKVPP